MDVALGLLSIIVVVVRYAHDVAPPAPHRYRHHH